MSTTGQTVQTSTTIEPRSNFVTVVAWIFIALSGFTTLISILQNIMIGILFRAPDHAFPTVDPATGKEFPWIFRFMFEHFQLFFLAFFVVSALTLAASIGLLRRKNWARLLFIALMGLGIAWNVAGVLMLFPMFSFFNEVADSAKQPGFADQFGLAWKVMAGVNLLFVAAFVWLFGWIIKRLASERIRREFAPQ